VTLDLRTAQYSLYPVRSSLVMELADGDVARERREPEFNGR
jgi:hypothetical protein